MSLSSPTLSVSSPIPVASERDQHCGGEARPEEPKLEARMAEPGMGLGMAVSPLPTNKMPTLVFSITYSLIAFPLSPKSVTLNDLEWPFCVKFCFAPLCLDF